MRLGQRCVVKFILGICGFLLLLSLVIISVRYSNIGKDTIKALSEFQYRPDESFHQSDQTFLRTTESTSTSEPTSATALTPACLKNFGEVGIFLVFTNYTKYAHATNTLRCYAVSRGYRVVIVHAFHDKLSLKECGDLKNVFFRKHCVASVYLAQFDWLMVIDADVAVINSNRCIEEYLDEQADVIFYERFFSAELMSGSYVVKNSHAGRYFLRSWAAMQDESPAPPIFSSADNGFIHLQMLRVLFPENITLHEECFSHLNESIWPNWEVGYGKFIGCTKRALINGNFSDKARVKVKVLPRAQAWSRDTAFTGHNRWEGDFMAHGIKETEPFNVTMLERLSVFKDNIIPNECWNAAWKPEFVKGELIDVKSMSKELRSSADWFEKEKLNPIFGDPHFERCWPKCPPVVRNY